MNSKISQKRYSLVRNSIIGVLVLFCSTLGLIYYYSRIPEIQVEGYVTYKDSNKDDFYIISIKTRNISIYDKRVEQYQPSRNIERSPNQSLGLAYDEEIFRHYIVHPDNRRVYFKYWCLSLNEMDWSPNSNYIVYRGDDDNGKWIAKIFIMNTKTGKTDFLTTGDVPRWMIPKEKQVIHFQREPSRSFLRGLVALCEKKVSRWVMVTPLVESHTKTQRHEATKGGGTIAARQGSAKREAGSPR